MLKSVDIGLLIGLFYIFASSQLYLLVTFFFAVAGGYYLSRIFAKEKARFIVVLAVILCTSIVIYMHNDNYRIMHTHIGQTNEKPEASNFFYLNGAEYVPDKAKSAFHILLRGDSIASINGNTAVESHSRYKHVLNISINTQSTDSLELPLFYYKGYTALLNDKKLPITQSTHGLIQIPVNETGDVKVYYEGTIIQKVNFYLSILSILCLIIYIWITKRRKNDNKAHR